MLVLDIAIRRKGLCAITLTPPPPKGLLGAEYEGERLLVDRVIVGRLNIVKGQELSLEDVNQLIFVSECYRAKNKAVWYLSRTDYSEKSLYEKLCRSYTKKAAAFAIEQMVKKGYLNDERYAACLVERLKAKNLSAREIKAKLYLKGVSKELIDKLFADENPTLSDYERLVSLINSKYSNKIGDEDSRRKTVQALRRRGFSFSNINKALGSVLQDVDYGEEII